MCGPIVKHHQGWVQGGRNVAVSRGEKRTKIAGGEQYGAVKVQPGTHTGSQPSTSIGGCELRGAPHKTRQDWVGQGAAAAQHSAGRQGGEWASGSSSTAASTHRPSLHSAAQLPAANTASGGAKRARSSRAPHLPRRAALLGAGWLYCGSVQPCPTLEGQRAITGKPATATRAARVW